MPSTGGRPAPAGRTRRAGSRPAGLSSPGTARGYDDPRGTARSVARHGPADPNRHDRRLRRSPAASRRASACASSWTIRATRGSRSRFCRSSSPRSTRLAAGPLVCVLPDDAQARDAAEGAGWYLGRGPGRPLRLARRALGKRARAAAAPRRRAGPGPRGAGGRRPGLRVGPRGRRRGSVPEKARPEPIVLGVGDEPGVETLAERLALAGYERVPQAEERGQFAVRGGIVDIFPSTGREPVRVELFGDEIESLRAFSPFTQRTLHGLERGQRLPGGRAAPRPCSSRRCRTTGEAPAVPADLVAPLPAPDLVWQAEEVEQAVREELGVEARAAGRPPAVPAPGRPAPRVRGAAPGRRRPRPGRGRARPARVRPRAGTGSSSRSRTAARRCGRRGCSAVSTRSCSTTGDDLPDEPGLVFAVSPARRGFVLRDLDLILLPDTQVFRKRPPRTDVRVGRALQSFADLRTGDHVVHEDHGVGKLLGFETKTVAGVTRDYLFLAFKGDDRLYVPHEQIAKVSRYVGADGHAPALSKLGGKAWQTIKNRARAGAQALAGELLVLYAQRQRAEGVAFEADTELVERLEASFAYEETPDQRQAIEVVKEDLEAPRPMDRLVCGDVGYGKTEVADPRGLHRRRERSAGAPARPDDDPRAAALEHLPGALPRPPRDGRDGEPLPQAGGREGACSPTSPRARSTSSSARIACSRATSSPRTSGLVIVDEEQRFGVAQKELLRQLRLEVDVLSLSATPIPRTLHMSLAGLRDISVIETPPQGRRPIRTHVGEYDEELVREALLREHERGGQSFFLHNRVESIEEAAEHLRQLCPELRFLVAHGQMPERELETPHALVPRRRRRRARLDDDHRVRASTSRRRTRSSSSGRTRSASPSSTRSAAGSAEATSSPTRTSSIPTARS